MPVFYKLCGHEPWQVARILEEIEELIGISLPESLQELKASPLPNSRRLTIENTFPELTSTLVWQRVDPEHFTFGLETRYPIPSILQWYQGEE